MTRCKKRSIDARPGDEILIRHTGELRVEPLDLKKSKHRSNNSPDGAHRPHPRHRLDTRSDASLFRVVDGKCGWNKLEFRLQPPPCRNSARRVSPRWSATANAVSRTASSRSIRRPGNPSRRCDAGGQRRRDENERHRRQGTGNPSPRLAFENCFVRGKGDLIWSRITGRSTWI